LGGKRKEKGAVGVQRFTDRASQFTGQNRTRAALADDGRGQRVKQYPEKRGAEMGKKSDCPQLKRDETGMST